MLHTYIFDDSIKSPADHSTLLFLPIQSLAMKANPRRLDQDGKPTKCRPKLVTRPATQSPEVVLLAY